MREVTLTKVSYCRVREKPLFRENLRHDVYVWMGRKCSCFLRSDMRMQRLQHGVKGSYEEVCTPCLLHPFHLGDGSGMDTARLR